MPEVTAIVSAYYCADFLRVRLGNLDGQSPRPEIIMIAQEGSQEAEYAGYVPDVKVILTPDVPTLYAAWNMAIEQAQGEYLTSANSDDLFFRPSGLKTLTDYLDAHPEIDVVHGDCYVEKGDKTPTLWVRSGQSIGRGICRIGTMPVWRRSLHDRFGMFDSTLTVCGDYDFWLRCWMGGAKFAHVSERVGVYRLRSDSLEHRNEALSITENRLVSARYKVAA